jgi:hypothetical protein
MHPTMEETAEANKSRKPGERFKRRLVVLAASAAVMVILNLGLNLTQWKNWEEVSNYSDSLLASVKNTALLLSPAWLWNRVFHKEDKDSPAQFEYKYRSTENLTIKEKFSAWIGYYWQKESGAPFWPGRFLLFLGIICGIALAIDDHRKAGNKTMATLLFPVNAAFKSMLLLLVFSLSCILFYYLSVLFFKTHTSTAGIGSMAHLIGAFLLSFVEEVREHVLSGTREAIGKFIFPFLYRK